MMTMEERKADRLDYERRTAIDAIGWLRRGAASKAIEMLAYEISMGDVEGEWIAMATRRLIRRGHARRLVEEVSRRLWCDFEAGEIDERDLLGVDSLDDPRASHLCDMEAIRLVRQSLDQWTVTHWPERYTETPRGRRFSRAVQGRFARAGA